MNLSIDRPERICKISKLTYCELMSSMPPESRALTISYDGFAGRAAIVLISPFGYRLLFVMDEDKDRP